MAQNSLSNLGRELPKEPSREIILKFVHRFSRRMCLKLFLFIALSPCSMEWNHLSNIGRGLAKEHFCEIISKSVHKFREDI